MAAAHDAFFSVHSQLFVVSALHVSLSVFVAHGSVSAEKEYIIKYNDIKIGSLPFKSHEIYEISKVNKSYDKLSKTIFHTLTLKDVQLYIVLRQFPHLKEKWEQLYPAYKSEYFDTKVDINELYNLMLFYMNPKYRKTREIL